MDEPTFYRISVKGQLDTTLAAWFEDLIISNQEDGIGVISGYLPDQAALQGILKQISSLGMTLISVNSIPPED
jgi:hypothetical protein